MKMKKKKLFVKSFLCSIRGTIVTTLVLTENFGMLTSYIIGTYYDFYVAPKVMIVLTVIFGVLLLFFPESPTFLVKQNKLDVRYSASVNPFVHQMLKIAFNHSSKIFSITFVRSRKQQNRFVFITI